LTKPVPSFLHRHCRFGPRYYSRDGRNFEAHLEKLPVDEWKSTALMRASEGANRGPSGSYGCTEVAIDAAAGCSYPQPNIFPGTGRSCDLYAVGRSAVQARRRRSAVARKVRHASYRTCTDYLSCERAFVMPRRVSSIRGYRKPDSLHVPGASGNCEMVGATPEFAGGAMAVRISDEARVTARSNEGKARKKSKAVLEGRRTASGRRRPPL
jgi:hypothetical protein